jgi:hypothetical protein
MTVNFRKHPVDAPSDSQTVILETHRRAIVTPSHTHVVTLETILWSAVEAPLLHKMIPETLGHALAPQITH